MIRIEVETTVFPTEDPEIIKKALSFIYPFIDYEISEPNEKGERHIHAQATGRDALEYIFNQVRKQRTVETVRRLALERMDPDLNICRLMLNKQALTQGFFVTCSSPADSPLGPVYLTLKSRNIEELINYLFPHTEKGKVIESKIIPEE